MKQDQLVQVDHWVHGVRAVVKLRLSAVIPYDDPAELCFDAATMSYLREVRERADAGDIAWLQSRGTVYAPVTTASAT